MVLSSLSSNDRFLSSWPTLLHSCVYPLRVFVSTVALPKSGPKKSSPPVRYCILKRVFIGCGSQPRNTTDSPRFCARSTCDSMPASLDWTILKPASFRPKAFLSIIA
ncbi:hypothetical protein D9M71_621580 [compost metagenome]